jgi:hypothetical protein
LLYFARTSLEEAALAMRAVIKSAPLQAQVDAKRVARWHGDVSAQRPAEDDNAGVSETKLNTGALPAYLWLHLDYTPSNMSDADVFFTRKWPLIY